MIFDEFKKAIALTKGGKNAQIFSHFSRAQLASISSTTSESEKAAQPDQEASNQQASQEVHPFELAKAKKMYVVCID